jgi:hypothetical protein
LFKDFIVDYTGKINGYIGVLIITAVIYGNGAQTT